MTTSMRKRRVLVIRKYSWGSGRHGAGARERQTVTSDFSQKVVMVDIAKEKCSYNQHFLYDNLFGEVVIGCYHRRPLSTLPEMEGGFRRRVADLPWFTAGPVLTHPPPSGRSRATRCLASGASSVWW